MADTKAFEQIIEQAVKDTGVELQTSSKELARYAQERASHLVTLIGQDGYEMAVIAERDNVILRAGISAVGRADNLQARFIGVIQGALGMAAQLLA